MDNSTIATFPNQPAIREQAGAWIVKIDRAPLTEKETAELQLWMAQSDFHKQYIEKLAKNWDAMDILQELSTLFPINPTPASWRGRFQKWLSSLNPIHARPSFWPRTALVTSTTLLTACLFIFSQPQTHFETAVGQQAIYQLSDGSTLSLNTNSEADIEYSDERRVVRLHRGEASFEVAKNPERPFMVYAGEGMVWAVGTAFNVRYQTNSIDPQQAHSIDVIVTEGTIKVFTGISTPALVIDPQLSREQDETFTQQYQKDALANAGLTISYSHSINSISIASQLQLEKQQAWQQGALLFRGETLEEAMQEISRYTTKKIIITENDIKNIRIGGYYKTDDISTLLAALSEGFGIQVTQASEGYFELSKKTALTIQ